MNSYEDGVLVGHAGAWQAGQAGALPGLIMPGTFVLGSRYAQERAPGIALDRAEHVRMGLTVMTPAGTFEDCVKVVETTPLETGQTVKVYCPGIGLVADDGVKLVAVDLPPGDDQADEDYRREGAVSPGEAAIGRRPVRAGRPVTGRAGPGTPTGVVPSAPPGLPLVPSRGR